MPNPEPSGGRFGKYAAIVMKNSPDKGEHTGWVSVQIPALPMDDGPGEPKPLEVWASPSFLPGFFFVPDEGAHVLVEFINGDIGQPVWTGVYYPDKAPAKADGNAPKAEQKVIRTPGGSVVEIDDAQGSEKITIARGKAKLVMEDGKITLECGQSKLVLGDDGIELAYGAQSGVKLAAASATVSHLAHKLEIDSTGAGLTSQLGGAARGVVLSDALKALGTHMHIALAPGAPTSPSGEWNALAPLPAFSSKAG
jgi:Type VI secretion system/phage-baseplate injector OB domain